jgi:hypothetical protein
MDGRLRSQAAEVVTLRLFKLHYTIIPPFIMLTKNVRALIHAISCRNHSLTHSVLCPVVPHCLTHTHTHTHTNVHTALYTVDVAGAEGRTVFHRATSMDNARTRNKSMPTEDRTST